MNKGLKPPLNERVVKNIRILRELRGITREQIADAINMSLSGYSKIERGSVDITLNKLEEIAKHLSIDPELLLSWDPARGVLLNNHQENGYNSAVEGVDVDLRQKWIIDQIEFLRMEIERIRRGS